MQIVNLIKQCILIIRGFTIESNCLPCLISVKRRLYALNSCLIIEYPTRQTIQRYLEERWNRHDAIRILINGVTFNVIQYCHNINIEGSIYDTMKALWRRNHFLSNFSFTEAFHCSEMSKTLEPGCIPCRQARICLAWA